MKILSADGYIFFHAKGSVCQL